MHGPDAATLDAGETIRARAIADPHRPRGWRSGRAAEDATPPARRAVLHRVAEPCTLRSAGGRVRDGLLREAGERGVIVAGVGGLDLGQEVDLVLPRRGGLRLRARIAGIGVLGLMLDLRGLDCGAEWRHALLGMTDGAFRAA